MKQFMSDTRYVDVKDGGSCPHCQTMITSVNLLDDDVPLRDPRECIWGDFLDGWRARMRNASTLMTRTKSSGYVMRSVEPRQGLGGRIGQIEDRAVAALSRLLQRGPVPGLLDALRNRVIDSGAKQVHSNASPLLVFRFFTGRSSGLNSSTQGVPWKPDKPQITVPDRTRGTMTKLAKNHQRGVKEEQSSTGKTLSDVVSVTCSLRNLVTCSAGGYQCTPGGQVIPIIFSLDHIQPGMCGEQWAPRLALILLPAGSYSIDWTDHNVSFEDIKTAPDISFFEREVSYDTWGGNYYLGQERVLCTWNNVFRGMIQRPTQKPSTGFSKHHY